jgi:hypothetical protein
VPLLALVVDAHLWEEEAYQLKGTWQRDFLAPDSVIVGSSQASYRTYLTTCGWLVVDAHLWQEDDDQLKGTCQRDNLTPDSVIVGSSQARYRTFLTTGGRLIVDAHLLEEDDPLKGPEWMIPVFLNTE